MSGHSKWHNIQKTKGAQDAKRAAAFTKIAKEMYVAVKEGGGSTDPSYNSRLATVITKAKAANMPNDNIKRVLEKAANAGSGDSYESITYEGYGPSGIAVIVETMTDSRNRTAGNVRHHFDKYGGKMGAAGCVSWNFSKKGVLVIDNEDGDYEEDNVMMDAMDCGADDFEADGDGFILRQNGTSDRAGLDGARFGPGESDVYAPELTTLDGVWQDALGETLVIDTGRMEYLAYSPDGMTGGTIRDGGDGLGVYLFLNGRGYFAVSPDGNSFTLFFEASDTNAPDGTYEGVFYRDGNADRYADLDNAEFYASDGHLRYYDGENIFFLPDTYAVAADGLAYDGAGNVYAAGWDMPYYDPADDWGDNWASNWG